MTESGVQTFIDSTSPLSNANPLLEQLHMSPTAVIQELDPANNDDIKPGSNHTPSARCKPAISSMSLGRAWRHNLPHKLHCAKANGIVGLELFFEDLEYHAREHHGGDSLDHLLTAAAAVSQLCRDLHIEIICLQPLAHYEALKDRREHQSMIRKAKAWFTIARELDTNMILIPATFREPQALIHDFDLVVSDLTELADLGAEHGIRFAYESLCWSTLTNTWEASYAVVQRVNRLNFGICLDTFNIAGRIYADPSRDGGKTLDADLAIKQSMKRMLSTIDVAKVFFIQIVDAEKLSEPLVKGHEYYNEEQPCRMSWSRNCRLFYGEEDRGAYLPIKDITKTIFSLGFRGWVSMELFSRTMADPSPSTPAEHAQRAGKAWRKISQDFKV